MGSRVVDRDGWPQWYPSLTRIAQAAIFIVDFSGKVAALSGGIMEIAVAIAQPLTASLRLPTSRGTRYLNHKVPSRVTDLAGPAGMQASIRFASLVHPDRCCR